MLLVSLLAACGPDELGLGRMAPIANTPLPPLVAADDPIAAQNPDVRAAVQQYQSGRPDVASALVNRALQSQPRNARLHYLNGQIYLAWSRLGFPQYRDLAAVAFRVALNNDPGYVAAARALASLYSESNDYDGAELALAAAINQNPTDEAALLALGRAAYLAGQPTTARWAVEKVLARRAAAANDAGTLALAALAEAGSGDAAGARSSLTRYAAVEPDQAAVARLTRAVEAWPLVRERALASAARVRQAGGGTRASAPGAPARPAPAPPPEPARPHVVPPPPPPALRGGLPFVAPAETAEQPANQAATQPPSGPPVSSRWDACDTPPNDINPGSASVGSGNNNASSGSYNPNLTVIANQTDTLAGLPPLPSPCADRPQPRMALIDVIVIRVAGTTSSQYGVNLLQNLQVVLNAAISYQGISAIGAAPTGMTTLVASAGLPQGGITYSLNIANAFYNRTEIVARPTLVALDRRSSRFFSGQAVVAGLPGGSFGGSSFIEIPTGVELVITPTFVDADTVLLSVRASRSSFEQQQQTGGGFTNQLLTARNAVTASVLMKMGDTLILSGLTNRELDRQTNKVPLLGDIPGLDVALGQRSNAEINDSVLILLTPRSSAPTGQNGPPGFSPAEGAAFRRVLSDQVRGAGLDSNADARLTNGLDAAARALVLAPSLLPAS